MSDSELSDAPSHAIPPDSDIQEALKNEVTRLAEGPSDEFTVSGVRKATEISLGLPEGFFAGDAKWKARSKTIIKEHAAVGDAKPESQAKVGQTLFPASGSKKFAKRSSPNENKRPPKKQKVDSDEETSALSSPPSDSTDEFQDKKSKKGNKNTKKPPAVKRQVKAKSKSKTKVEAEAEASDVDEEPDREEESGVGDKDDGAMSEMSDVLDEAPPNKRKSKSADTSQKKVAASKSKTKANTQPDPDQEEIKRLQSWLAKCGVRKVWGKELKPYETSKAKIKYLKEMLADIGMTGRYSNDKAAQIKEARELAADIEAVTEGNERWGKNEDGNDGDDSKTRGGRRLVRGAKNYDFLSSDGEETD